LISVLKKLFDVLVPPGRVVRVLLRIIRGGLRLLLLLLKDLLANDGHGETDGQRGEVFLAVICESAYADQLISTLKGVVGS